MGYAPVPSTKLGRSMQKRDRILFFYTHRSTFVKGDLDILSERYQVKEYLVRNSPKYFLIFSLIKQFFHLLFFGWRYDIYYVWFADYHSFLPSIFSRFYGKPIYIVIGGYDVCRDRRYGYGSFANRFRGYMALKSMKLASMNLCVSRYVERIVAAITKASNHTTIYNGTDIYIDNAQVHKEIDKSSSSGMVRSGVLCVSVITNRQNYHIKGVDRFVRLAEEMQDVSFTLVGSDSSLIGSLYGNIPPNLKVVPKVDHRLLVEYYKKTKIYCQLSQRESFSLSLVEAMYYNAIPVVTNVGGMPEVTGGLGYVVRRGNSSVEKRASHDGGSCVDDRNTLSEKSALEETVGAIREALQLENNDIYHKRIVENFTIEIRKSAILNLLNSNAVKQ